MNLTGLSLKYNRITLLALFVTVVLGLVEYGNLSRDSMPPFTVRIATIITQFPGASPERVESLISDKVEKVLQEIPEVKTVTSISLKTTCNLFGIYPEEKSKTSGKTFPMEFMGLISTTKILVWYMVFLLA
jgi:Cu/Ag efflux pump CusA